MPAKKKKVSKRQPVRAKRKVMFGRDASLKRENEELKRRLEELESSQDKKKFEQEVTDLKRLHEDQMKILNRRIDELEKVEDTIKKKFDADKGVVFKTMELSFKEKQMNEIQKVKDEYSEKLQKGIEDNYEKLKGALSKLHEEGNAQTKFTEKIALKMMDAHRGTNASLSETQTAITHEQS